MERFLGLLFLIGAVALIAGGIAMKNSIESYWKAFDIIAIETEQRSQAAAEEADQKAKAAAQEAALFDSKIAEYASQKWDTGTTRSQGTKPIIRKIIIIDIATKKQDNLSSSLPEEMQAKSSQEVDAVVLIRRADERVGSYSDGAGAMRKTVSVSTFLPNGTPLCPIKKFRGSEPPEFKRGSGPSYGDEPSSEVISFIQSCTASKK